MGGNFDFPSRYFQLIRFLGAELGQEAGFAFGFSGFASGAAVGYEPVWEDDPVFFGDNFVELVFELNSVSSLYPAKSVAEPCDVGVDDNSRSNVKGVSQYDVCRLPADTTQLRQLFNGFR